VTAAQEVVISWRDCDCEWVTKFCDEKHVKFAVVDRDQLVLLVADMRPDTLT
jgi:hypothetical protein